MVYDAETGDLSHYAFLYRGHGSPRSVAEGLQGVFRSHVLPYVEGTYSDLLVPNAKMSHVTGSEPEPAPLAWVTVFRIKPGQSQAFHAFAEKYAAAAAKIHWEAEFQSYDVIGSGHGGADFIVVAPNKNWADAGTDAKPTAKQMMRSVYGKSKADAMHQRFIETIADQSSSVWSYDKQLSFSSPK